MKFKNLNIISPIIEAIDLAGYKEATEIQQKAIPVILGRNDIIGCAQTGTGKTASFAIPMLQLLEQQPITKKCIRALVLVPTRELAIQVATNFETYSKKLPLKHLAIFGGVSQEAQINKLKKNIDILIATPGRLLDLIATKHVSLSNIEILVLDEADRMLDMGFAKDVKKVLSTIPIKRQTLFFSATMPPEIRKLAQSMVNNPVEINVAPVSSTAQTIQQSAYFVERDEKFNLLLTILDDSKIQRLLVFTRTKYGADKLTKKLQKSGIFAAAIHGNKSQNARQKALNDFKNNTIQVLIATDIAARGIDIDELSHVVNYELPNIPETYVHRIGRTGRAGMQGVAISFCEQEERKDFKNIQKLIGANVIAIQTN